MGYGANRVDPGQMLQNMASDQDLLCSLTECSMLLKK